MVFHYPSAFVQNGDCGDRGNWHVHAQQLNKAFRENRDWEISTSFGLDNGVSYNSSSIRNLLDLSPAIGGTPRIFAGGES
jgi:hypothetical protein